MTKKYKFLIALLVLSVASSAYLLLFTWEGKHEGLSMWPTIKPGDVSIVHKHPLPEDLTGQIVVFTHVDLTICHRCIEDNGEYIWTQGDNNPLPDPFKTPKSDVLGIIIFVYPFDPRLMFAIRLSLPMIITLYTFFDYRKENRIRHEYEVERIYEILSE